MRVCPPNSPVLLLGPASVIGVLLRSDSLALATGLFPFLFSTACLKMPNPNKPSNLVLRGDLLLGFGVAMASSRGLLISFISDCIGGSIVRFICRLVSRYQFMLCYIPTCPYSVGCGDCTGRGYQTHLGQFPLCHYYPSVTISLEADSEVLDLQPL